MGIDPGWGAVIAAKGLAPAGAVPPESEAAFQKWVIDTARANGWMVAHFRRVRVQRGNGQTYYETPVAADGAGWPDLVLVRDRVLFRELKADRGRLSDEQTMWQERLIAAGADWAVWRPKDRTEIERALR
jgi:predicted protein tyrosine phosphatase